jgi:hypothetical protein
MAVLVARCLAPSHRRSAVVTAHLRATVEVGDEGQDRVLGFEGSEVRRFMGSQIRGFRRAELKNRRTPNP